MEIRLLRTYVAVAEELSFTRAAQRLHLAQPAISNQVRKLEAQVGVELIDRRRRAIALTGPGELMLDESRRILLSLQQAVELVRRAGSGAVGRLSIGFVPSASNSVLPSFVRRFGDAHPEVVLDLRERPPDELVEGLHGGQLDVAFLYLPLDEPAFRTHIVTSEAFVVALPQGHRLATRPSVAVRSLAEEPFVLPARHGMPGLHAQVLSLCRDAGFSPRPSYEDVWMLQTIVGLVAAGTGIALVPSSAETMGRHGVVYLPLRGSDSTRAELAAVWRAASPSSVLRAFSATLEEPPRPPL